MFNFQEWAIDEEMTHQILGGNGPAPGEIPDDLGEPPPSP